MFAGLGAREALDTCMWWGSRREETESDDRDTKRGREKERQGQRQVDRQR